MDDDDLVCVCGRRFHRQSDFTRHENSCMKAQKKTSKAHKRFRNTVVREGLGALKDAFRKRTRRDSDVSGRTHDIPRSDRASHISQTPENEEFGTASVSTVHFCASSPNYTGRCYHLHHAVHHIPHPNHRLLSEWTTPCPRMLSIPSCLMTRI